MLAIMNSRKVLFVLICVVLSSFSFSMIGCDGDVQALRAARARAEQRAETAEKELARVKSELAGVKTELEEGIPESMRKRIRELEKLIEKLPQATIRDVKIDEKKKNIDITVKFDIKNRKGIEGSVKGYFYFQDGPALLDKNGVPISISKDFTPKGVAETQTVKLSTSHAELNIKQPYDLKFTFSIYDEPTDSFLEDKPYSVLFSFDPFKD